MLAGLKKSLRAAQDFSKAVLLLPAPENSAAAIAPAFGKRYVPRGKCIRECRFFAQLRLKS
jgi:hypothetical protein